MSCLHLTESAVFSSEISWTNAHRGSMSWQPLKSWLPLAADMIRESKSQKCSMMGYELEWRYWFCFNSYHKSQLGKSTCSRNMCAIQLRIIVYLGTRTVSQFYPLRSTTCKRTILKWLLQIFHIFGLPSLLSLLESRNLSTLYLLLCTVKSA